MTVVVNVNTDSKKKLFLLDFMFIWTEKKRENKKQINEHKCWINKQIKIWNKIKYKTEFITGELDFGWIAGGKKERN